MGFTSSETGMERFNILTLDTRRPGLFYFFTSLVVKCPCVLLLCADPVSH